MCTKINLEILKDPHLSPLAISKRLTVVGLIDLEDWIPKLMLRSVDSEQTSKENQPLHAYLQMIQTHEYPFRTALHPVGSFSSGNPTKILSYVRIIEQEAAKAHLKTCLQLMELRLFPRHRPLFLGFCLG